MCLFAKICEHFPGLAARILPIAFNLRRSRGFTARYLLMAFQYSLVEGGNNLLYADLCTFRGRPTRINDGYINHLTTRLKIW